MRKMSPEEKLSKFYDSAKRGSENLLIQEKSRMHHIGYAKGILVALESLGLKIKGINDKKN